MGRRYLTGLLLVLTVLIGLLWFWKGPSFKKAQQEAGEADPIKIILDGRRIVTGGEDSVEVKDNAVVIRDSGTFLFTGKMTNGQIVVAADQDDEVILKFAGVELVCKDSAPVWIRRADKVTIHLKSGSENVLTDGIFHIPKEKYSLVPKGCIDSRANLKIKGSGKLTVNANYLDGVASTDNLKIKNGIIDVHAPRYGLRGTDCVEITGGIVNLKAGRDGIRSKDYVKISLSSVTVDAVRYGIFGLRQVRVDANSKVSVENALSPVVSSGRIKVDYPLTAQGKE